MNINKPILPTMELSEKAKKARNDYQREYRRKNPGKQKEYMNKYWEKKASLQLSVTDKPVTEINVTNDIVPEITVTAETSNAAICIVCEKPFIAKRSDAKYCSDKCRQKYYRSVKQSI